jgi:hypothetical protein
MAPVGCKATSRFVNLRLGSNFKASKNALKTQRSLLRNHQQINEVVRGMFHIAQQEQCFGAACALYEIEVNELVSVSRERLDDAGSRDPEGSTPAGHKNSLAVQKADWMTASAPSSE